MLGAIVLGLLAGYLARALTRGPAPRGCFPTMFLGLLGAIVGFLIFTEALHIGDDHVFDLGGLPGAVIGAMLLLYGYRKLVNSTTRGRMR
jgi:uncharacterized membrane protein YeaQ/YmgE (transglycosylase-associated protein family)